MADNAAVRKPDPEMFPPATAEQTAEAVFSHNKDLIEGLEPYEEAMQAIADEHDMMDRKYSALDSRLKKLERKGMLLPEANDEKILFYLALAYVTFEFILPAVIRLIEKANGEAKSA